MNKYLLRLGTAISSAALVASSFVGPVLAVDVEIIGNGDSSNNTANVAVTNNVTVNQTNYANITNDVNVDANTGNNDANRNTGGDVSIDTGNASADVDISNLANFNAADVDACGCIFDADITIKGNGYNSDNEANVLLASLTAVDQDNTYDCSKKHHRGENSHGWGKSSCNEVDVDLDTGGNDANRNTQDGEPSITTGDANGDVIVETTANSNVVGDGDFDFDFPDLPDLDGSASLLVLLLALFS